MGTTVRRPPVGPGPSSVRGLEWLARVGPAPAEAWAAAMGWSARTAFSHAERLEDAGWLHRHRMTYGHGSLLSASRRGVAMTGQPVAASRRPAPTWWAHLVASAWTAAWLTVRDQDIQGSREVDADDSWIGEFRWRDGNGPHTAAHRPDLAVVAGGSRLAVEVELARKSTARLEAIIDLHGRWRAAGTTRGVLYVCGDQSGCERIQELGTERGLSTDRHGGLRIETLARVRSEALAASVRLKDPAVGER